MSPLSKCQSYDSLAVTLHLYLSVQPGANLPLTNYVPHLCLEIVTATRHILTLWMRPYSITPPFQQVLIQL